MRCALRSSHTPARGVTSTLTFSAWSAIATGATSCGTPQSAFKMQHDIGSYGLLSRLAPPFGRFAMMNLGDGYTPFKTMDVASFPLAARYASVASGQPRREN